MKDENIKQLLYDIQREKNAQKQVALVKKFEVTSKLQMLQDYAEASPKKPRALGLNAAQEKIVPTEPVAQINKLSAAAAVDWIKTQEGKDDPFIFHKFAVGTKIQFPTFEKLRLEGWVDDGHHMVHPKYKTIFLSYMQIADFEDTVVTIAYQNNPGEYSIEEEGLMANKYDDWPFDLMNVVKSNYTCVSSRPTPKTLAEITGARGIQENREKLEWDDQSLHEQAFHILTYLESEPNQTIIPDARVELLKRTLGAYKPYAGLKPDTTWKTPGERSIKWFIPYGKLGKNEYLYDFIREIK